MLGGESSQTKRMKRVTFSLTSIHGAVSKPVRMEALTIDKICTPLEPVKISIEKYPHLKSLKLDDSSPRGSINVDVLIGVDFYFSFMSVNCKKGETTSAPTAVESSLRWIVAGPIESLPCKTSKSMLSTVYIDAVTDSLKQFWGREFIETVDKEDAHMSLEEEECVRQFAKGMKFGGERYEVPLLRKGDAPPLKSNYFQAAKRLVDCP